jgi:hypothetical protein
MLNVSTTNWGMQVEDFPDLRLGLTAICKNACSVKYKGRPLISQMLELDGNSL